MMRRLGLAGALLLLAGMTGCSTAITDTDSPVAPGESAAPSDPGTSTGDCGGLTTDDLVGIFGVELDGPEASSGSMDQNGTTWTSTGCDWENDAEEFEVDLDISQASDFPGGTIVCIEPGGVGEVAPVDGIGTRAWWKFEDFDEVEGELRVCTGDRLIELSIDAEAGSIGSDELRDQVVSAVRKIVG